MSNLKGLYNVTRPAEYNRHYPFTICDVCDLFTICDPFVMLTKISTVLANPIKSFRSTMSQKLCHVQQTENIRKSRCSLQNVFLSKFRVEI